MLFILPGCVNAYHADADQQYNERDAWIGLIISPTHPALAPALVPSTNHEPDLRS